MASDLVQGRLSHVHDGQPFDVAGSNLTARGSGPGPPLWFLVSRQQECRPGFLA